MKLKKILSAFTALTMLLAAMPVVSFADEAPENLGYPQINVSNFADMRSDVESGIYGTDIDLTNEVNYEVGAPQAIRTEDGLVDVDSSDGAWDETVYQYADEELQNFRRNKVFTFSATSNAAEDSKRSFAEEGTTDPAEGSIKIAYLDWTKQPLKMYDDNGGHFDLALSDWSQAWIDLTTVTPYESNLTSFFADETVDHSALTVNKILATGTDLQVVVYNIVADEFSGYLRVMVTDNAGNSTVKDFPIIVDGHYPEIGIETSTEKNPQGEVAPETEYFNTFISEYDFAYAEDIGEAKDPQRSLRYTEVHEDSRNEALTAMQEGKIYKYTMENGLDAVYDPTKIWAMDDVTVDTVTISDDIISSGIASVTYMIENDPDGITAGTEIEAGELEVTQDGYSIVGTGEKIVIENEGFNTLTITAVDNSGLKTTNKYYFFVDKTVPQAAYELVELNENVAELFSVADEVTNKQQGIEFITAGSVDSDENVKLISNIDPENGNVYQYRFLDKKDGAPQNDENGIPEGYTAEAPAQAKLTYGQWLNWDLDSQTPVLDEEFDGLIQVRVQDRAGNWSVLLPDESQTIIADSTLPESEEAVYRDADLSQEVSVKDKKTVWTDDTLYYKVRITDEDLINGIRSSGIENTNGAAIKVRTWVESGSQNESVTILGASDAAEGMRVDTDPLKDKVLTGLKSSFDDGTEITLTPENLFFDTDEDKAAWFVVRYEGTGIAYIAYEVTDNAGNVLPYPVDGEGNAVYNVAIRVDKISPYVTFKGMTADEVDGLTAESSKTGLLVPNNGKAVQYENRDMPWGPYNQVLEVTVNDDDITDVQSSVKTIKITTDKALKLVDENGDIKADVKAGETSISFKNCADIKTSFSENNGHVFYLVYEGTGKAKISVYAKDSVDKSDTNERPYPSDENGYDAMLRVDKTPLLITGYDLVEVDDTDVEDNDVDLFSINGGTQEHTTRQQMKLVFTLSDNDGTDEQSGVVRKSEGTMINKSYDKNLYVENIGKLGYLYQDKTLEYVTDLAEDKDEPIIQYSLVPVMVGDVDGDGGKFDYTVEYDEIEWLDGWTDGYIVIPREFQGAVLFRTTDRVGNVSYSEIMTFVAESNSPQIDFAPQAGPVYSQNNYGWSKRDAEYVEIRVKDNNIGDDSIKNPDAWLENVIVKVLDKDGNDITSDVNKVTYASAVGKNSLSDPSGEKYQAITEANKVTFGTKPGEYGYDILAMSYTDMTPVETAGSAVRDEAGYIHLGYIRVTEDAQIYVTVFDKAKRNGADYTGNKVEGIYTARFDRTAPVIDSFELKNVGGNEYGLRLSASDVLSGVAPQTVDADYNTYTSQASKDGLAEYSNFFGSSYLYTWTNDDGVTETFNKGLINEGRYELPGLQYALIPGNDEIDGVKAWAFDTDPSGVYAAETGYNGEKGKLNVWHNYVNEDVPVITSEFDGYIVVRAIDKAGNITLMGYSPIADITAERAWANETEYLQVKASAKWGGKLSIEYSGNNGLVYPADIWRNITDTALSEGGFVEVTNEGITNVVIKAVENDYNGARTVSLSGDEGDMIIGNLNAGGTYTDWKFHFTSIKIDKTAPTFDFALKNGEIVIDSDTGLANGKVSLADDVKLVAENQNDPIPNAGDPALSQIASGVMSTRWCAVPDGSDSEYWQGMDEFDSWKNSKTSFSGTIKVKVTDNAGNETVKTSVLKLEAPDLKPAVSITYDNSWKQDSSVVTVAVDKDSLAFGIDGISCEIVKPDGSREIKYLGTTGDSLTFQEEGEWKLGNIEIKASSGRTYVVISDNDGKFEVAEKTDTATAWQDVVARIDRTAPTFNFVLNQNEEDDDGIKTDIVVNKLKDPKPTNGDAASGIKLVEWCAVPEGSEAENWTPYEDELVPDNIGEINAEIGAIIIPAFVGTVKVRVTDNAGNITELSKKLEVDTFKPLVNISKSYTTKCSHEPVEVFVTVSSKSDLSKISKVTYSMYSYDINGNKQIKKDINGQDISALDLPLTGGTISIDDEGTTYVEVKAETKSGKSVTEGTDVIIHYDSLAMPMLENIVSGQWITVESVKVIYEQNNRIGASNTQKVYYSLNNTPWSEVENETINGLHPGKNTVRLRATATECACESDVNEYEVWYENISEATPTISIDHDLIDRKWTINDEDFNIVNSANSDRVVYLVPGKGNCASDIKKVTYYITLDGKKARDDVELPIDGTSLMFTDEGVWAVGGFKFEMESGETYICIGKDNEDGTFSDKKVVNIKDYNDGEYDGYTEYTEVVAVVDKTAPEFETTLLESTGDPVEMFGLANPEKEQLGIKVSATDSTITYKEKGSALMRFDYAVMEKGMSEPDWKYLGFGWDHDIVMSKNSKGEFSAIITKPIDGTVLIKVTDAAGNSRIKALPVLTESNAPEIALTTPYGSGDWLSQEAYVTVDILDKGVSSEIKDVVYAIVNDDTKDIEKIGRLSSDGNSFSTEMIDAFANEKITLSGKNDSGNFAHLNSNGGVIAINEEGKYRLVVAAEDYSGNVGIQSTKVYIDKTAPTYSGSVTLSEFNIHEIPQDDWNYIHDGWTYNHNVSLEGVTDQLSGIAKVQVVFTGTDGTITKDDVQTDYKFSSSGKYDVTITDNAGNVRTIGFTIDNSLKHTINVVEVDSVGKLNIAVTDGTDRLTFYQKDEDSTKFEKMYNGVTDQLWDGRTGVRRIYGVDDDGNRTNTLYVLVAPSGNYELDMTNIGDAPNRYVSLSADEVAAVEKSTGLNGQGEGVVEAQDSGYELDTDGIYKITAK